MRTWWNGLRIQSAAKGRKPTHGFNWKVKLRDLDKEVKD